MRDKVNDTANSQLSLYLSGHLGCISSELGLLLKDMKGNRERQPYKKRGEYAHLPSDGETERERRRERNVEIIKER